MQKFLHTRWLALILLSFIGLMAFSHQPAQAAPQTQITGAARITSFTSSAAYVARDALYGRRARVPVSWTTENRTIAMNLAFEQVLADGSVINVELPRFLPWVNSTGDGVTAPTVTNASSESVQLRVRLYNYLTGETIDQRSLFIPIRNLFDNQSRNNDVPAIRSFAPNQLYVDRDALADGSARIPVQWNAINRPIFTTLVFEQVVAPNNVVNVELPRDTPWVNSSGTGVVAPRLPADASAQTIQLRLRLYDVLFNRLVDQHDVYINVQDVNAPPTVRSFSSTTISVAERGLRNRAVLVDVAWLVENRPQNSNIAFEQVFYDGSSENIELPRDFVLVPSSGSGNVRPFAPIGDRDFITIRARLFDISNSNTYHSKEIVIQVEPDDSDDGDGDGDGGGDGDFVQIYDPSECLTTAFLPGVGLTVGTQGQVTQNAKDQNLVNQVGQIYLANAPLEATESSIINAGTQFTVLEGPYCYKYTWASNNQTQFRKWRVETASGAQGWVDEFYQDIQGTVYNLAVVEDDGDGGDDVVVCEHDFFFTDPNLPDGVCPTAPPNIVDAAFQPFGAGFMLWDPIGAHIYVTYADGTYQRFVDNWDTVTVFEYEDVPEGAVVPQRGFGQVWHDHPEIWEKLGWPTTSETGITSTRQLGDMTDENGRQLGPFYITKADGAVVKYSNYAAASGTWTAFQP